MDAADIAILETYADSMSPVEKGLLDEVRRLFDEVERLEPFETRAEDLEKELADAKGKVSDRDEQLVEVRELLTTAEGEVAALQGKVRFLESEKQTHEGHLACIDLDHKDGPAFAVRCHVSEEEARKLAPLLGQGAVMRVVAA